MKQDTETPPFLFLPSFPKPITLHVIKEHKQVIPYSLSRNDVKMSQLSLFLRVCTIK